MPSTTDWIMVGITAVYVIATILISAANIKSAKATREQLAESRRQYEDKKRMEIMPYIQFDKVETAGLADQKLMLSLNSGGSISSVFPIVLRMKNIGNGAAKDISYIYEWDNHAQKYDRGAFPIQALSSGESGSLKIEFRYTQTMDDQSAAFILRYRDLLENEYSQQLSISFKSKGDTTLQFGGLVTSSPVLISGENHNA
ncbi:MAG: hypothetical protein IKO91_01755 [Oscillospiraceae bacterium]|nr:hypothetical protein [Oscillospiraceae bacterium]